ncbi:MAG TPA: inositol monophosphatase family protein [Anaerolineales bacterium]|nr:inositol monophosphatase family protein [Anaerolineales bacterium]
MQPTISYIENLAREAGAILRAGYEKEHQVNYKGVIDLVTEVDHLSEAFLLGKIQKDFSDHHIFSEEKGIIQGSDEHVWYVDPLDGTVNYAHHIPIFCVSIAYALRSASSPTTSTSANLRLGAVYDPMRDEMFIAERGSGAYLNSRRLRVSATTELQQSLLVTGFPYNAWDTPLDNFANFVKFGKLTRGVRRLGSAALDLAYVGAGRFDGFWELALNPWDVAAGGLLCEEAGASVTNVDGGDDYISPPQSILAATPGIHARMLEVLHEKE